ncbi:hypothetical protein AX16_006413 [Volvariella volvacea WC 439]|nr:hypothetical protein AX16_006413 [Volvariella volvacea WC 439]
MRRTANSGTRAHFRLPIRLSPLRLSISALLLYLSLLGSQSPPVHSYVLVRDYSGSTFFDGWDFFGSQDDLIHGDVVWLNREDAFADGLASINNVGHAVMRVDHTTNVPLNGRRNSVRITSRDIYELGSLWIADITHLPWGCSVWPAFWTIGPTWPADGEIDIIEGVNLMRQNQMALHTLPGCFHSSPVIETGQPGEMDCSTPPGCTVDETKPNSFGSEFNDNGGGVWAAQFDIAGIWFWPRGQIPDSILQSNSTSDVDISQWGPPSAAYTNASCFMPQYFRSQQLVFDITLCGAWAGLPEVYQQTCSGECYADNVVGSGDRYSDAYYEINYVRAYTTPMPTVTYTSASSTTTFIPGTLEIPSTAPGESAVFTGGPQPIANPGASNAGSMLDVQGGLTVIYWWIGLVTLGFCIYILSVLHSLMCIDKNNICSPRVKRTSAISGSFRDFLVTSNHFPPHLHSKNPLTALSFLTSNTMSYVILGRAVKNEHIALGVLSTAFGSAWLLSGGKKDKAAAPKTVEAAKTSVPLNASSGEEEQFIKQFIAEAEKEGAGASKH